MAERKENLVDEGLRVALVETAFFDGDNEKTEAEHHDLVTDQ